jgi:hypothetical protein
MAEQPLAEPNIIISPETKGELIIDPRTVAQTMQELGISKQGIRNTSILVDETNRIATNGIAYPRWLGILRHLHHPQLRDAPGPIIRLSSVVKGKERSAEDMNRTLVHELEHVAQMERKDPNIKLGHIAIWGLAAAGGIAVNRLMRGRSKVIRSTATFAGAAMGQQLGYRIAPHEIEARQRAEEISTSAIRRI